jgi:pilus assembly protein CpaD
MTSTLDEDFIARGYDGDDRFTNLLPRTIEYNEICRAKAFAGNHEQLVALDHVDVGDQRVREFVARYNEYGHGNVSLLTPVGGSAAKAMAATAPAVRRALASAGLKGNILTGEYQATDERLAAPIRLSFEAIKAKVAHRCGEWPRDLASGASLSGWQNESYWNFGCAEQATLAAQIADPRDLLSPRGQTPSDIEMRMRGIDKLRSGDDPSTNWRLKGTSISNVGSGG